MYAREGQGIFSSEDFAVPQVKLVTEQLELHHPNYENSIIWIVSEGTIGSTSKLLLQSNLS